MRYNWIKDKVEQGFFTVQWEPGTRNLADFFTKAHPTLHFLEMRKYYCTDTPEATQIAKNKIERKSKKNHRQPKKETRVWLDQLQDISA
jgi:hypothetical protein